MAKLPSLAGSGSVRPPFWMPFDFQLGPSVMPMPVAAFVVSMRFK